MKYSSIPRAISCLWHSKKIWRKPGKAKVLIFDRVGSEVLLTYLDPKSIEILDLSRESLNLYVLCKCFLQWKLTVLNYMVQYLKCVKPRVALTFIDNNHLFYQPKSYQKDLITVFVQNGMRGESGDIFGVLKKQTQCPNQYHVDYMLTFGNAISREYSKYIEGKTIPIGSFKNNLYQSKAHNQPKSVVFISQYRRPPGYGGNKPAWIQGNKPIFWKQLHSAEEFLLPLLQQYCWQNRLELKICGRNIAQTIEERNYFRSLTGNATLEIPIKSGVLSSYEEVDEAEFVVFTESSLGYEALARGKKAAAFSIRGQFLGSSEWNFGLPADLPDNGPFWTNHAVEREFTRVMDYITTASDEEWERTRQRYIPELMEYDPGNTRFLKLMREIGVPLKREYKNIRTMFNNKFTLRKT